MDMDILCFSACFLFIFSKASIALDMISPSESLTDGMNLVSSDGSFELGFFSPGSSKNRYLGIWYKDIPVQTVVWVANGNKPINDTTGLLKIESTGNVVLLDQNITIVWSTNSTGAQNPILQLLESGNLVVRDGRDSSSENYLWQSFDFPSDTLLPGMKLGFDLRTGFQRRITAWKNWDDPSPGDLTYGVELQGNPEMVLRKGSDKYFRRGLWNGDRFSGTPDVRSNPIFDYDFVWNEEEVYYTYFLKNKSMISRYVLNQTESVRKRYTWNAETKTWKLFSVLPNDLCDRFGLCGANGNCDVNKLPACQCLKGFRPKSLERWNSSDWSEGCVHTKPLNCKSGDGFIRIRMVKTPDTPNSWVNKTMNLKECRARCLQNCSCMAYTNLDIRRGGSGCVMWFGDLIDIKQVQSEGQDLYIRVSASEAEFRKKTKVKLAAITATVTATVTAMLLGLLIVFCYIRRKRRKFRDEPEDWNVNDKENQGQNEDMELQVFKLATIAQATGAFSINNKLGQGGFGPVYKGTLANGQEIAVKRLSKSSGQGFNEFMNEVKFIAKLQHRNLVRLLGCCTHGGERMLVYEYMPNRSLDSFIFDTTRRKVLNWSRRFQIICGIARGLLYLHQDSRLRIIHRDLKAGNVLLDSEMNPKISDFGLARSFGGDQTEANTDRVVGTFGYMAPEYAIDGLFSIKSDVFSFGVLLLEIISGRQNRGFYHPNHSGNLIEHAWRLWNEGKHLDLADDFLVEIDKLSEILRCVHISLLCVEHHPENRPSMSSVVLMLGSESELPLPKQPGFLFYKKPLEADSSSGNDGSSSRNEMSVSVSAAR